MSADGHTLLAGAGTPNGPLYVSNDGGTNWNQTSAPIANWIAVASSGSGKKLAAAANGGGIYLSGDFGATWTLSSAPAASWQAIASSEDGSRLAAAVYGGGIYTTELATGPKLSILRVGNKMMLSWATSAGSYALQQKTNLASGDWMTMTNQPTLNSTNLRYELLVEPTEAAAFFRLRGQ
jgi:photosystem II stability/assembly factor-like uncharacterized protein